mgnify:CR=1 FL=1
MIEMSYVLKNKRPLYNHFYFRLRHLKPNQKSILQHQFPFYKKISDKGRVCFDRSVCTYDSNSGTNCGCNGIEQEIMNGVQYIVHEHNVLKMQIIFL